MKKIYSIGLFLLWAGITTDAQFLKANGTQIVNDKGDVIILRGMGFGGWMLQEGYMFRLSNLGQQYRIKEKITELVGKEKTDRFYSTWLINHTTKKDIDSMAAWGFNSVRLPMHYNLYTLPVEEEPVKGQQTWLEKGFELTDSLLRWCADNKMYLILDLHAAPGGQGNDLPISDRDPAKPSLWESEANQEKTIALWRKLAERYAKEPWMGGYDIINEPNWGFEDPKNDFRGIAESKNVPLKKLMVEITRAIREVDQKHIITIEGNGFGNNYRGILPAWDDNMVISFHKYGNFNKPEQIKGFLELRDNYNMPLWLGESGENSNTWFTEAIQLAETNGIGWAWWQLKKMGINNPLEIRRPAGYDKLLAFWSGKGPRPSEEEAWQTLQELLENLKIGNNIFHRDVIDAMFRQVHSRETIPFRPVVLGSVTSVAAVDFDLGRQRFAYYDKDSARYQYTPGVNTDGNRGHVYRNDGVDIQRSDNGYYISHIEEKEWLKYSFDVSGAGRYNLSLVISAENEGGIVSLTIDGRPMVKELRIPSTGSKDNWEMTKAVQSNLAPGRHVLFVLVKKGGFNFSAIQFEKLKDKF